MKITRIDEEQNSFRVWVTNDEINCEILEYSHNPTENEVFSDFQKILDSKKRMEELKALQEEEQKLLNELDYGNN